MTIAKTSTRNSIETLLLFWGAVLLAFIGGFLVSQYYNAAAASAAPTRYDVSADDDPFLGAADAPVTIIEYADYQCPYCAEFNEQTFPKLMAEYGDKIRFVYRDLPIKDIHYMAVPAAIAADCAGEQQKYWEYHDLLYANNLGLSSAATDNLDNSDDGILSRLAFKAGLDSAAFNACMLSGRYAAEVESDLQSAGGLGITSTPTFFINGIPLVGSQPFSEFKRLIEQELTATGYESGSNRTPVARERRSIPAPAVYKVFLPLVLNNYPLPVSITNGDFEQGADVAWTEYSSHGWPIVTNAYFPGSILPRSGYWLAWLGGGANETGWLEQRIYVPETNPQLSYYRWIASEDSTCGGDAALVAINGATVEATGLCMSTNTGGWAKRTINLSAYAGQYATLRVTVTTDDIYNSNLFLDDFYFGG